MCLKADLVVGWHLEATDGIGPAVQRPDGVIQVPTDDELSPGGSLDHEATQLVQVGDRDIPAGLLQAVLHLGEGHAATTGTPA